MTMCNMQIINVVPISAFKRKRGILWKRSTLTSFCVMGTLRGAGNFFQGVQRSSGGENEKSRGGIGKEALIMHSEERM